VRILHVYKGYPPVVGGIEYHVGDLATAQARRGHDVTVLVTDDGPRTVRERRDGVDVIRAGRWATLSSAPLSPSMLLERRRIDAVVAHLHFPYPPGEIAQLFFGGTSATVITYHSDIVRQRALGALYGPLLRRVLARADRILATSPRYAETSPVLAAHREQVEIVPLGIDAARFAAIDPAAVSALRARLAPGGETVFVALGRMIYYKGLDVLLRAFTQLHDVPARLALVGGGRMEPELRRMARELGVAERVTFAGVVPDAELPAWDHAADIYVSAATHRAEAFGISIIEAMASGKPAITTELGTGTSFVNLHGETGLVVPANDPAALAQAMRALAFDPEARRRFGAAARARVDREFTLDVMTERVLDVYRRVLSERSSGSPRATQPIAAS
jgi:rhamnosyl/mannosyltransferase